MPAPEGFTFEERKSGEVVIRYYGRVADVHADGVDAQGRMARLTGNDKHGNERSRR